MLRAPRTEKARQRTRELALEMMGAELPPRLRLRNATAVADLPEPQSASQRTRERLKSSAMAGNIGQLGSGRYLLTQAPTEERTLASVGGVLRLSAIEHPLGGREEVLRCEDCLWDTASYACVVTENVLSSGFRDYLKEHLHDQYRSFKSVTVQVQACFAFSGADVQIQTLFQVVRVTEMPNSRAGVVLGQTAFMDCLAYRSVPRAILVARGEEVDENIWGEIVVEGVLNEEGEEQAVYEHSVVALT